MPSAAVAVFGDFCLDAYWELDEGPAELSIETGLEVWRVRRQRYSPGGAGNVVVNLRAMGVGCVQAVGVVGDDLFGGQLVRLLGDCGAGVQGMLHGPPSWQTLVYSKPLNGGREMNRIDFGAFGALDEATMDRLASALAQAAERCSVVILNQQLPAGVSTAPMIHRINQVIAARPGCRFIVDSRHRPTLYRGAILKLNAQEAARFCGEEMAVGTPVDRSRVQELARTIHGRTRRPVFITRSENGLHVCDQQGRPHDEPGVEILGPIDSVGAGDTAVAGIAAVLAGGGDEIAAAKLANLAASVTVRKLHTTGSASPDEIRQAWLDAHYIHEPELAADPARARYVPGTTIEIIRPLPPKVRITHALFDHDGTLSTLRHGWGPIMVQAMTGFILGDGGAAADQGLIDEVEAEVRAYIERSTGLQSLTQMAQLVHMVRRRARVPEPQILDAHGYKNLFYGRLMEMVGQRQRAVRQDPSQADRWRIIGVMDFLASLSKAGVRLHLTSGTDQKDVEEEANLLGYGGLFAGAIRGASHRIKDEPKRDTLRRILADGSVQPAQVLVIGDGPVEIRQGVRQGCLTLGIASTEEQDGRVDPFKRARLIRAGAHRIVPDYGSWPAILKEFGVEG